MCLIPLVFALSAPASATELKLIGKPKVGFDAAGPAGLDIDGDLVVKDTGDFAVRTEGDRVIFTVQMKKVTTGIELRDHHMCDKYMLCDQFPTAELSIARADLAIPTTEKVKKSIPGVFTARGQPQDVTVDLEVAPGKTGFDLDGSFHFDYLKFGLERPGYLGASVDPDIVGHAKFTLVDV